jgi:hypothetical protein
MFSVFISRTVSSESHVVKSVAFQQPLDRPSSIKFSNTHARRSNIFQCPVYAALMVLTTRTQKKNNKLGFGINSCSCLGLQNIYGRHLIAQDKEKWTSHLSVRHSASRAFGFISSIVKLIHQGCRQLFNRVSTLVINLTLFVCHNGKQDRTSFLFLHALHVTSSQDDRLRTEQLGSIPGRDRDLFVLR